MNQPKQFSSPKEREEYIASLSAYALLLSSLNNDVDYLATRNEREIAILSIIATAPELCDEKNIRELVEAKIVPEKYILNRKKRTTWRGGVTNLYERKIRGVVESSVADNFSMPKYNIDTIIHELIHVLGSVSIMTNCDTLQQREEFNEKFKTTRMMIIEGTVEGMTGKVMSTPRFFEICEERNYTPKSISNNYDLEVGLIGLMNLAYNDDFEKWHALGPKYESVFFTEEQTLPSSLRVIFEMFGTFYTNERDSAIDDRVANYNNNTTTTTPLEYHKKLPAWITAIVRKLVPELIEANLNQEAVVRLHDYLNKIERVFTDLEFDKVGLLPLCNSLRAYYPLDFSRVNKILENVPEAKPITLFSSGKAKVTSEYPRLKLEAEALRPLISDPVVRAKYIETLKRCREEEGVIKYAEYLKAKHGDKLQVRTPREFLQKVSTIALACQDWDTLFYLDTLTDETSKISRKSKLESLKNERETEKSIESYFENLHQTR